MKKTSSGFLAILLVLVCFLSSVNAQLVENNNKPGLVLLCVAAHPDDEDGATLAYYTNLKGVDAYSIFYTRGEGGQNEIGPQLYDELGIIREQETKSAAKILGTAPVFLGFLDFGFSKTAKETFRMWGGEDSVLARIVYIIREIKPDVVITNHDTITTMPRRQHGNHQAAGVTIFEAFDKAADPTYHPEQLKDGITTWQIHKLYFRVLDTAGFNRDSVVIIDANQQDRDGNTIEQIAFEALSQHRTQGMDKINMNDIPAVFRVPHYELVRSDKPYPYDKNDLFSGIKPSARIEVKPESFPTVYSYIKVNPEDSLRLLKGLKYPKDIYIGLVSTYDNTIKETLEAFKIKFDILDSNSAALADLSKYSTILLDIRSYFYRPDLAANYGRFLSYAENGGNIICFYQKPGDWNNKNFAPYPIFITTERVTEEDAKVTVLEPNHIFFKIPNPLNDTDWNGWVQERNIYLPSDNPELTSPKYEKLLAMSDEGETQPSTSLLYSKYGAGTYTYISLALYRQLKIFNEGALKLFLNMISQPKH